ncbi:DUF4144 family protein [Vibrio amylolyticus]|uniref:DUF4144 family protein n=1 Tax=Vibrio amylolyticus TaxID=2847292 RepID=UPI00354C4E3F
MINWPCLLKLNGDDELVYLESESKLMLECHDLIMDEEDIAIDSQGVSYQIQQSVGSLNLIKTGNTLDLEYVTALIQAHEFSQAELCLTKIHFSSISEAIESMASQY